MKVGFLFCESAVRLAMDLEAASRFVVLLPLKNDSVCCQMLLLKSWSSPKKSSWRDRLASCSIGLGIWSAGTSRYRWQCRLQIVLVEIVQVEGSAERIWRREQTSTTNSYGEVGSHIQACCKTLEQMRNRHVASIMVNETVVGECILASVSATIVHMTFHTPTSPGHGERTSFGPAF